MRIIWVYLYGFVYYNIINKEVVMQVIAEPISATAKEEVIYYYTCGIPSLFGDIIIRSLVLCVGCVGTRLG